MIEEAEMIQMVWGVLKWIYVFAAGLFVVFSIVVLAQIKQMVMALKRQFNSVLMLAGFIYMAVAGLVLIATIIIL